MANNKPPFALIPGQKVNNPAQEAQLIASFKNKTGSGSTIVRWEDITGKPTSLPPAAHQHPESDIINLVGDLAALRTSSRVDSFNTRSGTVTLTSSDVTGALGFTPEDSSSLEVDSFNTRTGAVTLASADVTGALNFTPRDASIATVNTFNTRSGSVTLTSSDITTALTYTPVNTTDSRLSDSRTPAGSAGGDFSGNYPNPALGAVGTAGIFAYPASFTTDSKGRVTAATAGTAPGPQLPVCTATGSMVRWNGSAYVENTSLKSDGVNTTTTGKITSGGLITSKGSLAITPLLAPTGVTAVHSGASGSTTIIYIVSAYVNGLYTDFSQNSVSNSFPVGSFGSTFNTISWNPVEGAEGYTVCDASNRQIATTTGLSAVDTGSTALPNVPLPATNQTGAISVPNAVITSAGNLKANDSTNSGKCQLFGYGYINYFNPSSGTLNIQNIGSNEIGVNYQKVEIYNLLQVDGTATITTNSTTKVPLLIKLTPAQTADFINLNSSTGSGGDLGKWDKNGFLQASGYKSSDGSTGLTGIASGGATVKNGLITALGPTTVPHKFAANSPAITAGTSVTIAHGLGTSDCVWNCVDTTGKSVYPDVTIDATNISLTFSSSYSTGSFRVIVQG